MTNTSTQSHYKILMITCFPFFSLRGTPISVKSRLEILSALGHQVDVIAYHVGDDFDLPGVNICRIVNIPFIKEVPAGPSLKKLFLDIFVCFKTVRFLVNKKYDLIYTHEEANYFGAVFSRIFNVRHLADVHGLIPQVLKNFGYGRYKTLIHMTEIIQRRAFKSSHGFIPISPDIDDYIKRINDRVPTAVIVDSQNDDLSNAITMERLDSFKLSHPELEGKHLVFYAGTFEYYQGLELLISSAELVLKEIGNTVFILTGGRKQQIDALKLLAEKHGVASHFHFTGTLPINEVALYMKITDILISTRSIGNNPPLKIFDYMRAGKPIVATNIRAHTQIINKDIAVLVDPSSESIARGIVSVLENPSYAHELGQKSRKFFENNYSTQEKIERTRQILDAVMQEDI